MKILIDTNIILDLLLEREPFIENAIALFEQIEQGNLAGYIAATTITNIFYIIRDYGSLNSRLRVVYDNGTESDLLLRSLQRALNKDKASRRITTPDLGPLFSDTETEDDLPTGYIYVLRSNSNHPFIVENRAIVHKIGVTSGNVKKRIANAKKDATYLLAEVEIVATFKLANIKRQALESLLHRFFENAQLDLGLPDRFGTIVKPREWFLVPLEIIEAVIERIKEGTIDQYRYDPQTATLRRS